MSIYKNSNICPLKKSNGFTLVELMVIFVVVSVLASIATVNYIPLQRKARDSMALSDARNLVEGVVNAILNDEDVDYNLTDAGGPVGSLDTSTPANSRPPVYVLSPGVKATITGASDFLPGSYAYVEATIYHPNGTPGKEFVVFINEATGDYSLP